MRNILIVILFIFPFLGIAQSIDVVFNGSISNFDIGKKEAGVTIKINQGGTTISSATTASNGKYTVKGKVNITQPFDVVFTKNGFATKIINFNLKGINLEDTPAGDFKPVESLDLDIFGERPGVDFSFLNTQPVGRFTWDAKGFVKVDEPSRKQMADKIDKLLKESEQNAKNNELAYSEAIKAADKAYNEKKYTEAMAKYEEAISIPGKAKEKHPNDRIVELLGLIQKEKESQLKNQQENAAYINLIKEADKFRDAGNYEKAIDKYNEAIDLKDDEQYPFDQIKAAKAKIKEREDDAKYKKLMEAADIMVKQKSYRAARDNYQEASKLKLNEQLPKDKLKEIDEKIKAEEDAAALKQKYEQLITEGDALVKAEKWEEAKPKFQEALTIEKASTYAKGQLDIIDKKLAEINAEKEKLKAIEKLLKEGDDAQKNKQLDVAINKYREVLKLDDKNTIAPAKIKEIEDLLAAEAKNKELNDKFNALVKQGDDAVTAKKYADAIAKYTEALTLKEDAPVKVKKSEAEAALAALEKNAELEANFKKLIEEGTQAQIAKNYNLALEKYQAALNLKPSDEPTLKKVSEVKKLIADQQEIAQKQQKIEQLIQEGISLMEGSVMDGPQLEPAKNKFKEALTLDANNATAKDRIAQIDKLLAGQKELADKEVKFKDNVAKGDAEVKNESWKKAIDFYQVALTFKDDQSVKDKIAQAQSNLKNLEEAQKLEQEYQKLIKEANDFRDAKKLTEALAKYEAAKNIKPTDNYAQQEIDKIKSLLDEQKLAAEKKQQLEKLLAEGETLFTSKDFANAKNKFNEVLTIEKTHAAATKRIADCEAELAKLAGEAAKQQQIAAFIQEGKSAFDREEFEAAEKSFKSVLELDKSNATATQYLADIKSKLEAKKKANDLKKQWEELVSKGDAASAASKWEEAINLYSQAIKIENNQQVADKIANAQQKLNEQLNAKELDAKYQATIKAADDLRNSEKWNEAILKYTEAKQIKPNETYPQLEIDKINLILANKKNDEAKNAQIASLLTEGQNALTSQDYNLAKTKYQAVLALDAKNATATNKLAEISAIEAQLLDKQKSEEQFAQLKASGKEAFNAENYDKAISDFEKALKIKNDTEITNLIAQIASKKAANTERKAEIDRLLAKGKEAFDKKAWADAAESYNKVLKLDENNLTAKSQLAIIEGELLKAKNSAKIAEEFEHLKAQGLTEYQAKEWEKARHSFSEALKLKSDSEVSKKLEDVNKQLEELAKIEKLKADYANFITKAENAEAAKNYSSAIENYTAANNLQSSKQLTDKIEQLKALLEQQKALSAEDKKFNDLIAKGDELVAKKDYTNAIQKYNEALKVKPNDQLPVIKAKEAERLASEQKLSEEDAAFDKIITAINNKIDENDFKKARDYIKTASQLRPTDPRPAALAAKIDSIEKENSSFAEFMDKGAKNEKDKKYQDALTNYEKAKVIKPNNAEVIAKIDALRKLIDEQNSSLDKEKLFKQYYDAGIAKASVKEYELALNNFKNALNQKPSDSNTLQKIAEIESILAKIEAEKAAKLQDESAFNKIILEADDYFNSKEYQKAGETYRKALYVRPEHAYAKMRLAESERLNKLESEKLANQQYQKILDVADGHLVNKDYDKALEYYNRALNIKSNDPYPKNKINEINGILNPVTENSDDLKDLGEPFDGSILDGEMALKEADAQRKELKRSKIKALQTKELIAISKLNENKQAELTNTIGKIYNLYTQLIETGKVQSANQIDIASNVRAKYIQQNDIEIANQIYKRQDISYAQERLVEIENVTREKYDVSSKKQQDNHLEVDKVRMAEEDAKYSKSLSKYDDHQATNKDIVAIKQKVDENTFKSSNDVVEISKKVDVKRTTAEDAHTAKTAQNYDKAMDSKNHVESVQAEVSQRGITSKNKLDENNQKLVEKATKIEDKGIEDVKQQYHEAIGVDAKIIKHKEITTEKENNQEVKRIQTVEEYKIKELAVDDAAKQRVADNETKNNDVKIIIEKQDIRRAAEDEKASIAQRDIEKEVKIIEASTHQAQADLTKSDKSERIIIQSKIDIKKDDSRERDLAKEQDIKDKGETVKDLATSLDKTGTTKVNEKANETQKVREDLNKFSTATTTKTIVPNVLGEKYPEGVSQEMFQRKDDAGILIAIITRRIVVIEGRGNEYTRTQTNHAITYTKNGSPITEYTWQKETQDAKLQRHY